LIFHIYTKDELVQAHQRKVLTTSTKQKKETPEGLWHRCPSCKHVSPTADNEANLWVCVNCGHHQRIGSKEYFHLLFDDGRFELFNENIVSNDPLQFTDSRPYNERLEETREKTGLNDAIRTAIGTVEGEMLIVAAMDFNFIGGSMGSVVGEKLARAIDRCLEEKIPLLVISRSGGARMMEAAYSLMQMAKTSARLSLLSQKKIPFISLLTDPTTGGITASFAMLGDLNIAEPGALIGFAGPRVIKETIGKDLPKDFQTSEFVLEHGFLDKIVPRKELKQFIANMLSMFAN
jgi:acetyl-CoA carboxylase carboxyl transferase subunit beta